MDISENSPKTSSPPTGNKLKAPQLIPIKPTLRILPRYIALYRAVNYFPVFINS